VTLFLVRHGRAAAGLDELDPGLDDCGVAQAERAAAALERSGATRLLVSPLRRTRETAAPIAALLGLEPQICDAVSEVFLPSQSVNERKASIGPLLGGRWSVQSEDLRQWRRNVVDALIELGGDATIVVSHFVAISVAIGEATGDDRVSPCALANASITRLRIANGRLVLQAAGEVAHLDPSQISASNSGLPGLRPKG
jgi:broad specificity phosphatase PhoE